MQLDSSILFEDSDFLVLNKPPGVVVNDATSVSGETVQSWLHERMIAQNEVWPSTWHDQLPSDFTTEYGTPEEIFLQRQGIVHRIDKDTSGALILAKHPGSLINLMDQFKKRTVHKTYRCLVHGKLAATHDLIKLPIARSTQQRQKFQVDMAGRPAETEYWVEAAGAFPQEKFIELLIESDMTRGRTEAQLAKEHAGYGVVTLVRCMPKTGRTHQIRVHFSFLQHPLVGDTHYLGKRGKLDELWCARQFLHAAEVSVRHPRTGEAVSFTAPLTADLLKVLSSVGIETS